MIKRPFPNKLFKQSGPDFGDCYWNERHIHPIKKAFVLIPIANPKISIEAKRKGSRFPENRKRSDTSAGFSILSTSQSAVKVKLSIPPPVRSHTTQIHQRIPAVKAGSIKSKHFHPHAKGKNAGSRFSSAQNGTSNRTMVQAVPYS